MLQIIVLDEVITVFEVDHKFSTEKYAVITENITECENSRTDVTENVAVHSLTVYQIERKPRLIGVNHVTSIGILKFTYSQRLLNRISRINNSRIMVAVFRGKDISGKGAFIILRFRNYRFFINNGYSFLKLIIASQHKI